MLSKEAVIVLQHYLAEGLRLGEQVALSVLADLKQCLNERFVGFSLTTFDGETVVVGTVDEERPVHLPPFIALTHESCYLHDGSCSPAPRCGE